MTEDEAILQEYEKQLRIAMERVTEMEEAIAKHKLHMGIESRPTKRAGDVCHVCGARLPALTQTCVVCGTRA